MPNSYKLAIDTGGSKTLFKIYDSMDNELFETQTQGFGVAVESEDEIPVLNNTLNEINEKYKISKIAVNVGGKNINQITAAIKKYYPEAELSIFRESQGCAALGYGRANNAKIILLAGTGVIGIGENDGNICISDGWGANIGDAGSGYYIGLETIKLCLKELDGIESLSEFTKEITGRETPIAAVEKGNEICDARDAVRAKIGCMDRKKIASYSKVAGKYAFAGDKKCIEIFKNSGVCMGELAVNIAKKLNINDETNVAVLGGLVNVSSLWAESFENTVKSNIKVKKFIYDGDGVIKGTLKYKEGVKYENR